MLNTILPVIHIDIIEFWQDLEETVWTDDAPSTLTSTNMEITPTKSSFGEVHTNIYFVFQFYISFTHYKVWKDQFVSLIVWKSTQHSDNSLPFLKITKHCLKSKVSEKKI
jgi:hypothetical protein